MRAFIAVVAKEAREAFPLGLLMTTTTLVVSVVSAVATEGNASMWSWVVPILTLVAAAVMGARAFRSDAVSGLSPLSTGPMRRGMVWLAKALAGYALYVVFWAVPTAAVQRQLSVGADLGSSFGPVIAATAVKGAGAYLLAFGFAALGVTSIGAMAGVLVLSVVAGAALSGLLLRAQWGWSGAWLSQEPGPTASLAAGLLPASALIALLVASAWTYAHTPSREMRQRVSNAWRLGAVLFVLSPVLALGTAAAWVRVAVPQPVGELQQVTLSGDGRDLVFAAGCGTYLRRRHALWIQEVGSASARYICEYSFGTRLQAASEGVVMTTGLPGLSKEQQIWLVHPSGNREFFGELGGRPPLGFSRGGLELSPDRGLVAIAPSVPGRGDELQFRARPGVPVPRFDTRPGDEFLGWGDDGRSVYIQRTEGDANTPRQWSIGKGADGGTVITDVTRGNWVEPSTRILRADPDGRAVSVASVPGTFDAVIDPSSQYVALTPNGMMKVTDEQRRGWVVSLQTGSTAALEQVADLYVLAFSPHGSRLAGIELDRERRVPRLRLYRCSDGKVTRDGLEVTSLTPLAPSAQGAGKSGGGFSFGKLLWSHMGDQLAMCAEGSTNLASLWLWRLDGRRGGGKATMPDERHRELLGWSADDRLVLLAKGRVGTKTAGYATRDETQVALLDPSTGAVSPALGATSASN